jgi:hypothetical protein
MNTVLRPCLINREIALGVHFIRDLQNFFGAYAHAKPASFAKVSVNTVTVSHAFYLLSLVSDSGDPAVCRG